MRLLAAIVLLPGCGTLACGDATYVTANDALAMWDEDGDGTTANLVEQCGGAVGSFGFRRPDLGLTKLLFDPYPASGNFEEALEVASLLLPAAEVVFYTEHLVVGNTITIDQLGGFGLHKLMGTIEPGYATYPILEGTIQVLEGPGNVPGGWEEDNPERWRFQWDLTFGDGQTPLQTWNATDAIDIVDGIEIGDEAYPPDWTGPR
jgi:hypothetical protein